MERLTFEGNFCDLAQCRDLPCPYDGSCTQRQVWERLKAYEDSRLSPQACAEAREIEETLSSYDYSISRMVELMKADKDGRDAKIFSGWKRNRRKRCLDPDWPTQEERTRYFEGVDGV